jgi:L-alanine-DL-glutamate epimerase-like enolase superfamily enzyme
LPELNVDKSVLHNLRAHLEAIRDGAGPNVDLLLDLNFNTDTEGYLKMRIMEVDIDRLPWDEELFTNAPRFEQRQLIVPAEPGWGTEPNEEGIRAHEPRPGGGLLNYRQP